MINIKTLASLVLNYILPPRCFSCAELIANYKYDQTINNFGFCADCWYKLTFICKPYCKICGYPFSFTIEDGLICGKCTKKLPIFDKSRSLMKFDVFSKKSIHAFKYHDKTALAKIFAHLLYQRYHSEIQDFDMIIPVPMHKIKRLFRMYNQAHILALEIAKLLNIRFCPNILVKTKWTKSQSKLSRSQREQNLNNSFTISKKYRNNQLQGKKILLIDDVLTTGSTIKECSKVLKQNNASYIYVLTIAMT